MSRLDAETKRKLREMGVPALVDALDIRDDALAMGLVFEERIKLAVDDAHAAFTRADDREVGRRVPCHDPHDVRRERHPLHASGTHQRIGLPLVP